MASSVAAINTDQVHFLFDKKFYQKSKRIRPPFLPGIEDTGYILRNNSKKHEKHITNQNDFKDVFPASILTNTVVLCDKVEFVLEQKT